MEKKNRIVLKELVERHKDSRLLAMVHRDEINAAAIAAHGKKKGAPPKPLTHTDNEVLDALYSAMKAEPETHKKCVEKYDAMAKQYNEHN